MVVKFLRAQGPCTGAVEYSEQKFSKGVASVAFVRNLEQDDKNYILRTFDEYVNNPGVYGQTKEFCLHMAVNPGPDDDCTDADVERFICDLLDDLGYAGQPTVVYKHFDIDRPHYHIVSVRVNKQGRAISSHFEGFRVRDLIKAYGNKYNFTLGKMEGHIRESLLRRVDAFPVFDPSIPVVDQIDKIIDESRGFGCSGFEQYQALLDRMGVRVKKDKAKDGNGRDVLLFQGLRDGEPTGQPVLFDRKKNITDELRRDWSLSSEARPERLESRVRTMTIVRNALLRSESEQDCVSLADSVRVSLRLMRPAGDEEMTPKLYAIDEVDKTVWSVEEMREMVNLHLVMAANQRWLKNKKDKKSAKNHTFEEKTEKKAVFSPQDIKEMERELSLNYSKIQDRWSESLNKKNAATVAYGRGLGLANER